MLGLSLASSRSLGNATGTAICQHLRWKVCAGNRNPQLTVSGESLAEDIVHNFSDVSETVDLVLLRMKRKDEPAVILAHLRELRRYFTRELNTMLERRIRFKSFAFDLFEQIRTTSQELVMGELPGLHVG